MDIASFTSSLLVTERVTPVLFRMVCQAGS